MANQQSQSKKWVFISHASADLDHVREVRNYLERQGASPLLFHLLALQKPDDFWPIIEREIEARNFFLYCESPAAKQSKWVKKEREAVEDANRNNPRRIGRVDVAGTTLDRQTLDDFLAKTCVFPSFARRDLGHVEPYLAALEQAGFQVFRETEMSPGESWAERLEFELEAAAQDGWVVVFLSNSALASDFVQDHLMQSRSLGAKLVPVIIEPIERFSPSIADLNAIYGYFDPERGPANLVQALLTR